VTVTDVRPEPPEDEDVAPRRPPLPRWMLAALTVAGALVLAGLGLVAWTVLHPAGTPAKLGLSDVYAPTASSAAAPVYLTITNTGDDADVLTSAGAEFQTGAAAKSVTVCADAACTVHTVSIPSHSTVAFGPAGPHLLVTGLGPLAVGHQPLQLTLTFQHSGLVHVLAPVGSAKNLTEQDVMTYGFMGHRDPGMMGGGMSGMPGMSNTAPPSMPTPSAGAPGMSSAPAPTTSAGMSGMPGM
jgi:copper(I)-binding protein